MNKAYLMSQMKSTGTGYVFWFFGLHYAYLGKWGLQILMWITLGGLGVWYLIDLFRVGGLINKHNLSLAMQIDDIEKKEAHDRKAELIAISRNNN